MEPRHGEEKSPSLCGEDFALLAQVPRGQSCTDAEFLRLLSPGRLAQSRVIGSLWPSRHLMEFRIRRTVWRAPEPQFDERRGVVAALGRLPSLSRIAERYQCKDEGTTE